MASNELDERIIESLKDQGARIAVWGVGTKLVTGADDGALGGVYKLGAVRAGPGAPWTPRLKVSESSAKTTVPGRLQVRRFDGRGGFLADAIYDEDLGLPAAPVIVDPLDVTRRREIPAGTPRRGPPGPHLPRRAAGLPAAAARGEPGAGRRRSSRGSTPA